MPIASHRGKAYWGYAMKYACYVVNCTGKVRLLGKTPFELLHGWAPNTSRFRVFGCRAWVLVPKPQRKKWDARAKEGVFVGFSEDAPAYLVRVPKENKTYESPHVLFDESDFGGAPPPFPSDHLEFMTTQLYQLMLHRCQQKRVKSFLKRI